MALFTKYLASAASQGSQLHPLAAAAAALSPPFTRIILLKLTWLSTTVAGNDKSTGYPEAVNTRPVPHFLLNECGLCQSELSAVLKIRPEFVATRSTHRIWASSQGSQLHPLAAAAAALSPLAVILFKLTRLSSTIAGNDKSTGYPEAVNTCPVSKFLLNECGLCQSDLSLIFKRWPSFVATRSTHTAQQVVQLFRDSGFTEEQLRKSIIRNPCILSCNVDRQLKPKFEFMKTLGLTAQDFGNIICNGSRFLACSLEKTLRPNVQYLQKLLGPEVNVSNVFKWVPHILIVSNGPNIWEKKLKHLTSFGLLEDEIKGIVRKHPLILNYSMDKVQKNMDFLMHTAGLPATCLSSVPKLVSFSLENRIKPRHKVLSAISAMQPPKCPPSLISAVNLTEQKFLDKYVKCSPHATKLLEIYSQACPLLKD